MTHKFNIFVLQKTPTKLYNVILKIGLTFFVTKAT